MTMSRRRARNEGGQALVELALVLPVILLLVVGMRLGCLNHAFLTAEAVARDTRLAGWIGNVLPPQMDLLEDNLATLRERLAAPCWGVLASGAEDVSDRAALGTALERWR